jgi:hypothetical protein
VFQFSELRDLARNLTSYVTAHAHVNRLFTYETKEIEIRSRIAYVHLHDMMRIRISKWDALLFSLGAKVGSSFALISSGYFSVMLFCVGYGKDIFPWG